MIWTAFKLLPLVALSSSGCTATQAVPSAQVACDVATVQVTTKRNLLSTHVALCDHLPEESVPRGYYVLALYADCAAQLCGSGNIGWFAVEQTTGEVFDFKVATWEIGPPLADEY